MAINSEPSGVRLRLGALTPRYLPVYVEREVDGETVEVALDAFAAGERAPGSIKADMSGVHLPFEEAKAKYGDSSPETEAALREMYRTYCRTLIPQLTPEEADTLSGDTGAMVRLMEYLGWWRKTEAAAEPSDNPPVKPTTGRSSRTSATATGGPRKRGSKSRKG